MEDEIVRYHHRLEGYGFKQSPGDSGGQGSLVCYSSWGCQLQTGACQEHLLVTEQRQGHLPSACLCAPGKLVEQIFR